jgi:hypothetical protein
VSSKILKRQKYIGDEVCFQRPVAKAQRVKEKYKTLRLCVLALSLDSFTFRRNRLDSLQYLLSQPLPPGRELLDEPILL